jgi:uncharacterized protein YndB with AHSA1/START domain
MIVLKSIGAIVAGFLTVVILSTGTDYVLETLGIFPPASEAGLFIPWMLGLALAYRTVYTVLGGYVTAWLAPEKPMRLVHILAVLGTIGGIAGIVAGWNLSQHWYPIALAVLAYPSVWLGGRLNEKLRTNIAISAQGGASQLSASKQEITITRMIDANRQKVWDAWTKPEFLSQWWGTPPMAATRETTSVNLQVDGSWRADMINAQDGTRMPFGGKYLEINSPSKLVFTIEEDGNPEVETVTITLKDRAGTTEMTMHQSGHLPPEQYGNPLRNGYNSFFERMINVIRRMQ